MKALPPYCSQEGLFIPALDPLAADHLRRVAPDDLETLESIGIPETWRARYKAEPVVRLTDRFENWVASDGRRVGAACVIAYNPIPLLPPSFQAWVVGSDGGLFLCSSLEADAVYSYNSSLTAFVVFVSALRAIRFGESGPVLEVLPELGRLDPAAFSEHGAWAEICAEWAYTDPAKDDEIERVRIVALGL